MAIGRQVTPIETGFWEVGFVNITSVLPDIESGEDFNASISGSPTVAAYATKKVDSSSCLRVVVHNKDFPLRRKRLTMIFAVFAKIEKPIRIQTLKWFQDEPVLWLRGSAR